MRPRLVLLALTLSLAAGCVRAPGVTVSKVTPITPATPKAAALAAKGQFLIGLNGQPLIGQDGNGLISQDGNGIISQDGNGLISQDGNGIVAQGGGNLIGQDGNGIVAQGGGNLISQDGNGIISQDGNGLAAPGGAGLISQDGNGLTGSVSAPASFTSQAGGQAVSDMGGLYHLAALVQAPVVGAHVYLRVADGRLVTDDKGVLLSAVTDAKGHFSFPKLAATNGLVVFVPLSVVGGKIQSLNALLTHDQAGTATTVDLASTLVSSYVLDRIVGTQPLATRTAALNRVPGTLDAQARAGAASALGDSVPAGLINLVGTAVDGFVDTLQKSHATLKSDLDAIVLAIHLAGSDATADGKATQLAISDPVAVAVDAAGNVYVSSGIGGVLRKIDASGNTTQLLGPTAALAAAQGFAQLGGLALSPKDGQLYFAEPDLGRVYSLSLDGKTLKLVLGSTLLVTTGDDNPLPADVTAATAQLQPPHALAFDAAGDLFVGEVPSQVENYTGRLLELTPQGALTEVLLPHTPLPPATVSRHYSISGLTVTADDALWLVDLASQSVLRRDPASGWQTVLKKVPVTHYSSLVPDPDKSGAVLFSEGEPMGSETGGQAIVRVTSDGQVTPYAGSGKAGFLNAATAQATFDDPAGLAFKPTGELVVADEANGLVRQVQASGVTTIGGTRNAVQEGNALVVPLDLPGGVAIDSQGRPVVAEAGSSLIERLDGTSLDVIAGVSGGYSGDGGPATAAQFKAPASLATFGDSLYVVDSGNNRLRKIDGNGVVTTVVGSGNTRLSVLDTHADVATQVQVNGLSGVAVAPDGRVYFSAHQRVYRLELDGSITWIAGTDPDDAKAGQDADGPALQAKLQFIASLALDPAGNLFISETGALRIRKVTPDGQISTFAGQGLLPTLATIITATAATLPVETDIAATQALLLLPAGIATDAAGNLYVAEGGTRGLRDALPAAQAALLPASLAPLGGRIRKITPDGHAHILAGLGAPAGSSSVSVPTGVAIDAQGRVVFVDTGTGELEVLNATK